MYLSYQREISTPDYEDLQYCPFYDEESQAACGEPVSSRL